MQIEFNSSLLHFLLLLMSNRRERNTHIVSTKLQWKSCSTDCYVIDVNVMPVLLFLIGNCTNRLSTQICVD